MKSTNNESSQLILKRHNQFLVLPKNSIFLEPNSSHRTKESLIQLHQCLSPNSSNSKSKSSFIRLKINNNDKKDNDSPFVLKKTISKTFKEDEAESEKTQREVRHTKMEMGVNNSKDNSKSSEYEKYDDIQTKEEDPFESVNRRLIKRDKLVYKSLIIILL